MKTIFKTMLLFAAVSSGLCAITSCSDDDDLVAADALFRPVINESDNIETGLDENNVPYMIVKWDNYTNADQYTVKVEAVDGSDSQEITTSELTCRFNNLLYDKEYFVYLSSANTKNGLKSKPFSLTTTTPDFPTNLLGLSATDIIDIAARVKWSEGAEYDQLKVLKDEIDSLVTEATVTAADNTAQQKVVYGLKAKTTYRVEAYQGGRYMGKRRFTTAAAEKFTGAVVDLRGLDEDKAWKWFSTGSTSAYANTLDSLIKTQYPDQDFTIVLEGGTRYRISTIEVPGTTGKIYITTGLSLAGEAQLGVEGGFRVAPGATLGGMVFNKVAFTDTENKKRTQDTHYGSTYVFNLNQADGNIGLIQFDNSSIKYKRGVCRIQTNAVIDSMVINNCVIDSISGYGITNADNAGANIRNIVLKNTTVSNAEKICVGTKGLQPNSLVVENCTFVYCIADNKPFFDFKSSNWEGFADKFIFRNSIIGLAGRNTASPVTTGITGWSGNVKPECSGLYFTSDLLWTPASAEDPTPKAGFDGVTLPATSDQLFKSPLTSDFTIIGSMLGGGGQPKPGDPRWY